MTERPARSWCEVLDSLEARLAHQESTLAVGGEAGFDSIPLPAVAPQGIDRVRALVVLQRINALQSRLRALVPLRSASRTGSPYS